MKGSSPAQPSTPNPAQNVGRDSRWNAFVMGGKHREVRRTLYEEGGQHVRHHRENMSLHRVVLPESFETVVFYGVLIVMKSSVVSLINSCNAAMRRSVSYHAKICSSEASPGGWSQSSAIRLSTRATYPAPKWSRSAVSQRRTNSA